MYATCIDTCSTLIYINYIHIQVRGGGGGGGGGPDPPDPPPLRPPLYISLVSNDSEMLHLAAPYKGKRTCPSCIIPITEEILGSRAVYL